MTLHGSGKSPCLVVCRPRFGVAPGRSGRLATLASGCHDSGTGCASAYLASMQSRGRAGSFYRMNCFRHLDEIAIVFCQACGHALCRQCSLHPISGVTHVCSDQCARKVCVRPEPDGSAESLFDNVYAAVFLTVLLAVLGGGFCVWSA